MSLGQRWGLAQALGLAVAGPDFEDRLARRLHEPYRRRAWPRMTRRRAVDRVDLIMDNPKL